MPDTVTETRPEAAATCPRCGEKADKGQLACLECGAPLSMGWKRPTSWRVPATFAASLVLLLGIGAGIAVGVISTGDEQKAPEQVAAQPPGPAPAPEAAPPAGEDGGQPGGEPAPSGGGGKDDGGSASRSGDRGGSSDDKAAGGSGGGGTPSGGSGKKQDDTRDERSTRDKDRDSADEERESTSVQEPNPQLETWPEGKTAYTVVLLSTKSRDRARELAREAAAAGIPAGVVRSDRFSTVEPGRYLVFGGQFDTLASAEQSATRYERKGFEGQSRLLEWKAQQSNGDTGAQPPPDGQ